MIHQHYDPQQILWFLRNFWKFSREDLIVEWHRQYDDNDFGKSQYQWLKSRYGMKGEWGAALNTPPYPGARPGGPGTENYEAPHVPVQPPRVTVRTQSRSPAPELTNTMSGHDAVIAAFNAASARSGHNNRGSGSGSSSSFHAAASSMTQMPPAITEAALQVQSSAVRAAVAAAAASNQQGQRRDNNNNNTQMGPGGLGSYNFTGGMPLPAPVSTGSNTGVTDTAPAHIPQASNTYGQMAYAPAPAMQHQQQHQQHQQAAAAPAPAPAIQHQHQNQQQHQQQHQQAGYNSMPTMPFAPDFGDSMNAQNLFSSNMPHGYTPNNATQFTGSVPTTTGPSVFPTASGSGNWMPSNMPGNGFMHLDGTSQMSGQGLMTETAQMPASVPMPSKSSAPVVSSPIMIEDDVESVAPSSAQKGKQPAQKRKMASVKVNMLEPSAKRPAVGRTPQVVAATPQPKAKRGRRGSKTGSKASGVSSPASTPGSASTSASVLAAPMDTWFAGVHGNCMLNMRHKHFADGGVYLAPAGENGAQSSTPVAEAPVEEDPHAAMARLMAGLSEAEQKIVDNSRVHITIPDSPVPTAASVETAVPKVQLPPANNTPAATPVTVQTGFPIMGQAVSEAQDTSLFGITPPGDSCLLALPSDANAAPVNAAMGEFDPLSFLVESPESLPRPVEETLTNAASGGLRTASAEPMLPMMQQTDGFEAGAAEFDPDLVGFDTQGFIDQLLLAGGSADMPLYGMGSGDANAEMPVGVDPMLTYSNDQAALEAAGMGSDVDHQ